MEPVSEDDAEADVSTGFLVSLPSAFSIETQNSPSTTAMASTARPVWARRRKVPPNFQCSQTSLSNICMFLLSLKQSARNEPLQIPYEVPADVAFKICEYAIGIHTVNAYSQTERRSHQALRRMVLLNPGQRLPTPTYTYGTTGRTEYWNFSFVCACGINNVRFRSATSPSPDVHWILDFFDDSCIKIPTLASIPNLTTKITGSPSHNEPNRPAFAGCGKAAMVSDSVVTLIAGRAWTEKAILQRWWDAHSELFSRGQRFYKQGGMKDPKSNFLLFTLKNPIDDSDKKCNHKQKMRRGVNGRGIYETNSIKTLEKNVTAALVTRWLKDIWGDFNVEMFVRVKEFPTGVQVYVFGPKTLSIATKIINAGPFQEFGFEFNDKTYIPL